MTLGEAMLRTWVLQALDAAGGTASPLEVSRHVWTHHRDELEAAGDLLLVWQVELRAAAEAMATTGTLTIDPAADTWSSKGGTPTSAGGRPSRWTDEEIGCAVEAYVGMLRDRDDGLPLRRREAIARIGDRTGRPQPVIEAMLANISAVVQELGLEPLPAFAPRSNVPAGVRPAVRAALDLT